jgi:hypothetical protein
MLTITNIDKKTEEILIFIAEKAGGKVSSALSKSKKNSNDLFEGNEDFNAVWSKIAKTYKNAEKKNKA